MKATNALVAAAVAGVLAAGTHVVSAAPLSEKTVSVDEKKKDDCPNKDKKKDDCPGKDKKKEGTIL